MNKILILLLVLTSVLLSCGNGKEEAGPTPTVTSSATFTPTATPTLTPTPRPTNTPIPEELRVPEFTKSTPVIFDNNGTGIIDNVSITSLDGESNPADGFKIINASISKNLKYAAIAGENKTVQVWDLAKVTFLYSFNLEEDIHDIDFSSDETTVIVNGKIHVTQLPDEGVKKVIKPVSLSPKDINQKTLFRTGPILGFHEQINILDQDEDIIYYHLEYVFAFQTAGHGETLVKAWSTKSVIHAYDVKKQEIIFSTKQLDTLFDEEFSSVFGNSGDYYNINQDPYPDFLDTAAHGGTKRIAYKTKEKDVHIYNTETGELVNTLNAVEGDFLSFSPDGSKLITLTKGTIIFTDIATGRKNKKSPPKRDSSLFIPVSEDTYFTIFDNTLYRFTQEDQKLEPIIEYTFQGPYDHLLTDKDSVYTIKEMQNIHITRIDGHKGETTRFSLNFEYKNFVTAVHHDDRTIALLTKEERSYQVGHYRLLGNECALVDIRNREVIGRFTFSDSPIYDLDLVVEKDTLYLVAARPEYYFGDMEPYGSRQSEQAYGHVTVELINPFDRNDYQSFNSPEMTSREEYSRIMRAINYFPENRLGYCITANYMMADQRPSRSSYNISFFKRGNQDDIFLKTIYGYIDPKFIRLDDRFAGNDGADFFIFDYKDAENTEITLDTGFEKIFSYGVSPNKHYMAASNEAGKIVIFDLNNKYAKNTITLPGIAKPQLAFSADSKILYASGPLGYIAVIDLVKREVTEIMYP